MPRGPSPPSVITQSQVGDDPYNNPSDDTGVDETNDNATAGVIASPPRQRRLINRDGDTAPAVYDTSNVVDRDGDAAAAEGDHNGTVTAGDTEDADGAVVNRNLDNVGPESAMPVPYQVDDTWRHHVNGVQDPLVRSNDEVDANDKEALHSNESVFGNHSRGYGKVAIGHDDDSDSDVSVISSDDKIPEGQLAQIYQAKQNRRRNSLPRWRRNRDSI